MYLRPSLANLPPSIHGARDYDELARLGLQPDAVIDFSANSNPYAPHPTVLQAVRAAVSDAMLHRYPDRACLALRRAIAAAEDVPDNQVLPANGVSELIQLVALAFVEPGSRHLILGPTFGEYCRAIQLVGGVVQEYRSNRTDLRLDLEAVAALIHQFQPRGIWLCTPNNPTGQQLTAAELAYLQTTDPNRGMVWVIDESYRYFGQDDRQHAAVSRQRTPQMIILRSLTKEHGLAGLRLGYAVSDPDRIETLRAVQPPWSVNSLAQIAGIAALQPEITHWRSQSLARLHEDAGQLWRQLIESGFRVLPTATPYALVEVGRAADFRHSLLKQGLLVRDCASFGLPNYIRIAAQKPHANKKLVAALRDLSERFNG
jgi:histidinol-phosphate aminotransferase